MAVELTPTPEVGKDGGALPKDVAAYLPGAVK